MFRPRFLQPGVVTVLTAADVPGEGDTGSSRHDEPLFPTEVMYHQQPVAWVLGETLEAARLGAERVRVEYEPLPAILTIEDAIAAGSFLSGPFRLADGDVSVIDSSPLSFDGELMIGGQEHFYLETQCAIAWRDETGGVAAHSSTQHPAEAQEIISRVLGLPRHKISVECLRMGGAFGGKEVQSNPWVGDRRARHVEDGTAGARPLDARARFRADRQAASVSGALLRGIRPRRPPARRSDFLLFRRRLEPGSVGADSVAGAISYRQHV